MQFSLYIYTIHPSRNCHLEDPEEPTDGVYDLHCQQTQHLCRTNLGIPYLIVLPEKANGQTNRQHEDHVFQHLQGMIYFRFDLCQGLIGRSLPDYYVAALIA